MQIDSWITVLGMSGRAIRNYAPMLTKTYRMAYASNPIRKVSNRHGTKSEPESKPEHVRAGFFDCVTGIAEAKLSYATRDTNTCRVRSERKSWSPIPAESISAEALGLRSSDKRSIDITQRAGIVMIPLACALLGL